MNSYPLNLKHAGLGFGLGLVAMRPVLLVINATVLALLWAGGYALRAAWRHWPGATSFLQMAGDFLMLLFILSLLMGALWVFPVSGPV
jgi:hypothetical protein